MLIWSPVLHFFSAPLWMGVNYVSCQNCYFLAIFKKYYFFLDESFCILVSYDANSLIAIYIFDQILID